MSEQGAENATGKKQGRLQQGLAKIMEIREMIAHTDRLATSIHQRVENLTDMISARFDPDKSKVTLKGVRSRQFFEAVRIKCENPSLSIYESCRRAYGRIGGTASDPGYPDFKALARFARRKKEHFA